VIAIVFEQHLRPHTLIPCFSQPVLTMMALLQMAVLLGTSLIPTTFASQSKTDEHCSEVGGENHCVKSEEAIDDAVSFLATFNHFARGRASKADETAITSAGRADCDHQAPLNSCRQVVNPPALCHDYFKITTKAKYGLGGAAFAIVMCRNTNSAKNGGCRAKSGLGGVIKCTPPDQPRIGAICGLWKTPEFQFEEHQEDRDPIVRTTAYAVMAAIATARSSANGDNQVVPDYLDSFNDHNDMMLQSVEAKISGRSQNHAGDSPATLGRLRLQYMMLRDAYQILIPDLQGLNGAAPSARIQMWYDECA